MPVGVGKYDDLCTQVREKAKAVGALVIVFEGSKGMGFSVQAPVEIQVGLPVILREVADQIEKDLHADASLHDLLQMVKSRRNAI